VSGRDRSREEALSFLLDRGMFGIEPGVEAMRELLLALGDPQLSFRKIHVVGTNGKSSTARFAVNLCARRGLRAGGFLSPHLTGFRQRVLLPGAAGPIESGEGQFADAIGTVAAAVEEIEDGGTRRITQFEAVTAAAFLLMAREGVEVGVVEAGLGGRLDATNVLGGGAVVLTSVSLDHCEWLGETVEAIAHEKLAVVAPGDTLVVAPGLPAEVAGAVAAATAVSGRTAVIAPSDPGDGIELAAAGGFQRRNLALAATAVGELVGTCSTEELAAVAASVTVPGRLQQVGERPDVFVDGAHNVEAMRTLAHEVGALAHGREVTAVVGVLSDKDASGMLDAMLGHVSNLVVTCPQGPRALPAVELASVATRRGLPLADTIADPRAALERAIGIAGPDGIVVCAGSLQLAGELLSAPGERQVTGS